MRIWFKFFGRDFRDGVRGVLSLEEAGAYAILLTLIYETENRLLDDERIICAHLNVDPRVWKRIRKRLLEVGKLQLQDGLLTNLRATSELSHAQHVSDVRRTSGRSGGEQSGKTRSKPLKTNDEPEANASILPLYARALPEADTETDRTPSLRSGVTPARKQRVASRTTIPLDMPMPEQARVFAAERGFLNGTADEMWTGFTAYHASKGTLSASVLGAWRTWVQNQIKFNGERHVDGIGAARAFSAGPRTAMRPERRSASTIIMERSRDHDLDEA